MGFASMFEEIWQGTFMDSQVRIALAQDREPGDSHVTSKNSEPLTRHVDEPPQAFTKKSSERLIIDGCPSYLIKHYVDWIWQYKIGQKSEEQLWLEFVQEAIPLMTQYLQRGDPTTVTFVEKHLLIKNGYPVR
jgi:hypothetical protein